MDNGACSYRRYLEGDEAAFEEIVNELFDKLVFFIDRYVRDPHAAEDIAVDVFADLIVHKNRYDFRVTLKTYMFMVGRSRALSYIKRRKRFWFVPLSDIAENTADETVAREFLEDERKQILNAAIGELPQDMQEAVHLVYFEELSYEEAACVMKKTKKQVDNLLYRAKKELRITLRKEELLL